MRITQINILTLIIYKIGIVNRVSESNVKLFRNKLEFMNKYIGFAGPYGFSHSS